jgi:hypothetical protein
MPTVEPVRRSVLSRWTTLSTGGQQERNDNSFWLPQGSILFFACRSVEFMHVYWYIVINGLHV